MLVCIPSFLLFVGFVVDQLLLLLLLWSLFMSRIKSVAHLNESFGYGFACHLVVVAVAFAALVCLFIGLFVSSLFMHLQPAHWLKRSLNSSRHFASEVSGLGHSQMPLQIV